MKKIIFLSAFTVIASFTQAQISYGVKAGVNLTKFSGSDIGDNQFLVGFAGGGLINYKLADAISLQGELLYSLEGASYKGEGSSKIKASYINIPILAQYNHASGFYAETGPQVGFLISAKQSYNGNSNDIKDDFKKINFSWGLGAGYKLTNGLGIGARYNLGITSIADGDANVKLGGFHIGLSYTFGGNE